MISSNAKLVEQAKVVWGFGPAVASTSQADFVSLKNYERCCIIIQSLNSTTVTGSAITLGQATSVANGSGKALGFSFQYANLDVAATDTFVETAVTSNTFTTTAVNSKTSLYAIEVKATDLDINNGFDCLTVNLATSANTTHSVTYILYPAKFAKATPPTAITD